jgi:hypothetical protein
MKKDTLETVGFALAVVCLFACLWLALAIL